MDPYEHPVWTRERELDVTHDWLNHEWATLPVAVHDASGMWPSIEQQLVRSKYLPLAGESGRAAGPRRAGGFPGCASPAHRRVRAAHGCDARPSASARPKPC